MMSAPTFLGEQGRSTQPKPRPLRQTAGRCCGFWPEEIVNEAQQDGDEA